MESNETESIISLGKSIITVLQLIFSVEGSTLDFDDCPAGEKQPQAGQTECVPCDADKGEFQTETGQTYCKTTKPGYQLNGGNPKSKLL